MTLLPGEIVVDIWLRCDSSSCWCRLAPRVIHSTGAVYTVERVGWERGAWLYGYRYMERVA